MMSRRRVRFCALSRNSIAAQRIRLKRMRLIRWMMIGTLIERGGNEQEPGIEKQANHGYQSEAQIRNPNVEIRNKLEIHYGLPLAA